MTIRYQGRRCDWGLAFVALALAGCAQPACRNKEARGLTHLTHAALLAEGRARGPRDCSKDRRFVSASAALGSADEQIQGGDFRRANIRLRDGLEELGDVFLGSDVNDDTGLALEVAWAEDWQGHLQAAAQERRGMLMERLTDYAQIENLKGCPSPSESERMLVSAPAPG